MLTEYSVSPCRYSLYCATIELEIPLAVGQYIEAERKWEQPTYNIK